MTIEYRDGQAREPIEDTGMHIWRWEPDGTVILADGFPELGWYYERYRANDTFQPHVVVIDGVGYEHLEITWRSTLLPNTEELSFEREPDPTD
ncbi:MAG TPA: hypothetical protein VM493_01275 [Vicinamibacterales bacterium]|jgi:hypothetical protein|nr:hypothetical protein [Vicinamibacterales bacterium]